MKVWFDGNQLCAEMPALILFDEAFIPMWKLKGADVAGDRVCVRAERRGFAIVRSGRGFGRRGNEKYYFVDFTNRNVKRVVHRPTKKLDGTWMVCVDLVDILGKKLCFEWRDGVLTTARRSSMLFRSID